MRRVMVWGMELAVYHLLWLVLVKPLLAYYVVVIRQMQELLAYYGY